MVGKTKYKTKADEKRLSGVSQMGCLPCMIDGWNDVPATVQHITEGSVRLEDEHQWTYPGCPWHHLGEVPDKFRGAVRLATRSLGPSFKHNKRDFAIAYGSERELVHITDALLRVVESERRRGGYLDPEPLGKVAVELHREIVLGLKVRRG